MKRTILFLVILSAITNLIGKSFEGTNEDQMLVVSISPELEKNILAATIQFQVFNAEANYFEQGLATLVKAQGQTILVSHNHWGFLSSCSKVVILDAESQDIQTLDCRAFKSLILFSSLGTLVLQAPEGLGGTPAELGSMEDIQPGKPVLIAHQNFQESSSLEVTTGQIQTADDSFHQNRVMRLDLLADGKVRKGDSGGGIWVGGKLVGNLWAYKLELKTSRFLPGVGQTSIAAIIPLESIMMASEPGEVSRDGLLEGSMKDKE
jgi:hypothetical protein